MSLHWLRKQISESSVKIGNVTWKKFTHYYLLEMTMFSSRLCGKNHGTTFMKILRRGPGVGSQPAGVVFSQGDLSCKGCALGPGGSKVKALWRKLREDKTKVWLYNFSQSQPWTFNSFIVFYKQVLGFSVCQLFQVINCFKPQTMRWVPLILSLSYKWGNWGRGLFAQMIQVATT